jgi:hypothetical protein
VGEKFEIDLNDSCVVRDGFARTGPVLEMAGTKVGSVQVALGFSECKFIGYVGKACRFNTAYPQCRDVAAIVIEHGKTFADVLDWFAFFGVIMQETCSGAFVAVDDEVNEASATLAGSSEFDRP